jgi:WD40 repeat protein
MIWNTIENKIESSFSEESEKNGTALLVTSDKIIVAFESGIGIWYFKDNEFKFGAPTISLPLDGFNHGNTVDLLLELPNNKLVSKIKIWDLSAKKCLFNFSHFSKITTFIVVKEELIVSYENHSVKIWNLMNEASAHSFISPIGVINYMELLPGGEVLMICEVGGTMGVWENNKLNYDFNSFESQITKAKVLTNGNVILSFINGSILVLK